MAEKTCFIIMPISTPSQMIEIYSQDENHFKHILEYLFIPAIESSGFQPIPPVAKGSDLIHAEIIKNLELADFVLCDITNSNPNVFFELGYRTSLNKPVCYVKDNFTNVIPFDQSMINHYTYSAVLYPWNVSKEISRLSTHLKESYKRSNNENSLWKYFGLKSIADPLKSNWDINEVVRFLSEKMDSIENKIGRFNTSNYREELTKIEESLIYRDKSSKLASMHSKVSKEIKDYEEDLTILKNRKDSDVQDKIIELENTIQNKKRDQIRIHNALKRALLEEKP